MRKHLYFFLLLLAGCGKNDDIAPEVVVTSPADNQVFSGSQTVNVKANITDNEGIHMVHATVTDNTTGGHMVHMETHPDEKSFNLNESFITLPGRNYTIEIEANDHNENTTRKELHVSAN